MRPYWWHHGRMRQLIVMRHAKSDWSEAHRTDHGRPLKRRGIESARAVGAALVSRGWVPDVALVSDALRAQQTWAHMNLPTNTAHGCAELYLGGPHELIRAVTRLQNPQRVLVLGHNPGIGACVAHLTGVDVDLKTADAVLLEADSSAPWLELIARRTAFRLLETVRARDVLEPVPAVL